MIQIYFVHGIAKIAVKHNLTTDVIFFNKVKYVQVSKILL